MIKKVFGLVFICFGVFGSIAAVEGDNPKILRVAEQFKNQEFDVICIEKIKGGLTNDNYKVTVGTRSYFFRLSFELDANLGNSLEREWYITSLVSKASIAPEVIFYSRDDGILVTDFIESDREKINLHDPIVMQQFSRSILFLHHLEVEFPTQYEPLVNIEEYVIEAKKLGVDLPKEIVESVIPNLKLYRNDFVKVPAHLDLYGGNLLKQDAKYWLIDWEYAAMADPFFDLATLASAENFSDQEMKIFLEYYLERNSTDAEYKHFYTMRIFADTRWALWCYIQAKVSPVDEGFNDLGNEFLKQCLKRIQTLD